MMLIGIDPHKSTHTATAIEPGSNREVASIRIEASLGEYRRMLTWARRWPQRRWAIENAAGLGRHLSSWLLARGEDVVDVPSTAPARVRQLARGGGRKNDRIDAAAAACVAALQGDARPLEAEGPADVLAVLVERRVNLAQSRVRAVHQLHALLRALLAGGAPADLSATTAAALLRTVRPGGEAERVPIVGKYDRLDPPQWAASDLRGDSRRFMLPPSG
jgi:transposase